jgi:hypothetical protein
MSRSLDKTNENLGRVDLDALEELLRRDQIGPDTYAKSSTGSSIVAGSRGGSELTPTERAAEQNMSGRKVRDPFRDDLRELEKWFFEMESLSEKIVQRQKYLFYAEEKKKRETSSVPCEAACPLPATKSGFCEEHFIEWRQSGAERQRFAMFYQQTRNTAGEVLVVEAPWNE